MRPARPDTATCLAFAAGALASLLLAAPASAVPPPFGGLTQLSGTNACVGDDSVGGACVDGNGLMGDSYRAMTLSPDGKHAYVASDDSNAVAILSRDPATGALTQLAGPAGCIAENLVMTPGCTAGRGLDGANGVAVSPDGKHVYVASQRSDAIAVFSRDPSTGALTQLPGTSGCTSEDGFDHPAGTPASCVDGKGLDGARSVQISADGANVYVASRFSNAVAIFSRNPASGVLTQLAGTAGCVSDDGSGGTCVDANGLGGAASVAISPNGANAYVASYNSGAVTIFSRDSTTGALTQLAGVFGCITGAPAPPGCATGKALGAANWAAVSPDGLSVYVVSIDPVDAVAVFARNPATGELSQLPGTAGCVSETGTGGDCADGVALAGASSLVVSPDNLNAYTTSEGGDAVSAFSRELPPVCANVSQAVPNSTRTTVALSCSDPNGDPITRSIATGPAHGSLASIDQAAGSVAYTPTPGFNGNDSFTFIASDGSGTSSSATASLAVAACAASGAEGALCVLGRYPPSACATESIPRTIGRRVDGAHTVLVQAQSATTPKRLRRLLTKARGKLNKAAKLARKADRKRAVLHACASALDVLLTDAAGRAR